MHRRTFMASVMRNRQLAGTLTMILALNALLSSIHTLEPTSGWAIVTTALFWSVLAQLGILAAAVAIIQEGRLATGTIVALTIFPTQAHVMFVRPQFWGWAGWHMFAVMGLVLGTLVYLHWLNIQQRPGRAVAAVTHMTARQRIAGHRHAA